MFTVVAAFVSQPVSVTPMGRCRELPVTQGPGSACARSMCRGSVVTCASQDLQDSPMPTRRAVTVSRGTQPGIVRGG